MSWKSFAICAEPKSKGDAAKVVAVSAEYEDLYGRISRDDAMDACDECYTSIRQAIEECRERGRHER